ncbi:MAG: hypothetical protein PHU24_09440, partial [Sphaerochaetaceae bacterium]|nr:hypothetical protein [Sphaerochaetaceae bacterium]
AIDVRYFALFMYSMLLTYRIPFSFTKDLRDLAYCSNESDLFIGKDHRLLMGQYPFKASVRSFYIVKMFLLQRSRKFQRIELFLPVSVMLFVHYKKISYVFYSLLHRFYLNNLAS